MTLAAFVYPVFVLWFYWSQNLKIIWLSNLSILSLPDEGYSRNASCAPNLISTFLLNPIDDYNLICKYNITIWCC